MSGFICARCRVSLRRTPRISSLPKSYTRNSSTEPRSTTGQEEEQALQVPSSSPRQKIDVKALLSKPTWSVRSLLPDPSLPPAEEITPKTLHHLLRLSALPLPKTPEEESSMLKTLHSQLHFVRDIQGVDTEGVEPLQSIRDETEEGKKEYTIELKDLKQALEKEVKVGHMKRPRRMRDEAVKVGHMKRPRRLRDEAVNEQGAGGVGQWDVFAAAGETVEIPETGKFFVVRSEKE